MEEKALELLSAYCSIKMRDEKIWWHDTCNLIVDHHVFIMFLYQMNEATREQEQKFTCLAQTFDNMLLMFSCQSVCWCTQVEHRWRDIIIHVEPAIYHIIESVIFWRSCAVAVQLYTIQYTQAVDIFYDRSQTGDLQSRSCPVDRYWQTLF